MLVLITLPHYGEALKHPAFIIHLFSNFGLDRHALERILYLAPIVWAGFLFNWKGAFITSLVALTCMFPRAIFISLYPIDALSETGARDRVYIDQINEMLPPGTYLFSLEVKNPQTSSVFDRTYRITVPRVTDESLLLSDVQLASGIQSLDETAANPAFVKRKLMVMPYPFSRVSRNKPVTFYFEIYNLMLDETGGSSYTVDYAFRLKKTGFWQKINPFRKRGAAISSSYSRTGERGEAQEYFSTNFEELKPGEYTVSIAVTDEVAKTTRSSVVLLQVVE